MVQEPIPLVYAHEEEHGDQHQEAPDSTYIRPVLENSWQPEEQTLPDNLPTSTFVTGPRPIGPPAREPPSVTDRRGEDQ
jgi:hypothetical protein